MHVGISNVTLTFSSPPTWKPYGTHNDRTYTALLNTTTKQVASIAACLTLLSYVSTAVVSASTASAYFHSLVPAVHVEAMTILILGLFAVLNLIGV